MFQPVSAYAAPQPSSLDKLLVDQASQAAPAFDDALRTAAGDGPALAPGPRMHWMDLPLSDVRGRAPGTLRDRGHPDDEPEAGLALELLLSSLMTDPVVAAEASPNAGGAMPEPDVDTAVLTADASVQASAAWVPAPAAVPVDGRPTSTPLPSDARLVVPGPGPSTPPPGAGWSLAPTTFASGPTEAGAKDPPTPAAALQQVVSASAEGIGTARTPMHPEIVQSSALPAGSAPTPVPTLTGGVQATGWAIPPAGSAPTPVPTLTGGAQATGWAVLSPPPQQAVDAGLEGVGAVQVPGRPAPVAPGGNLETTAASAAHLPAVARAAVLRPARDAGLAPSWPSFPAPPPEASAAPVPPASATPMQASAQAVSLPPFPIAPQQAVSAAMDGVGVVRPPDPKAPALAIAGTAAAAEPVPALSVSAGTADVIRHPESLDAPGPDDGTHPTLARPVVTDVAPLWQGARLALPEVAPLREREGGEVTSGAAQTDGALAVTAGAAPSQASHIIAAQRLLPAEAGPAPSVADQVAPAVVSMIQNPGEGRRLSISITPEELGQVSITVERAVDGTTAIHVTTERLATLDLLRRDQADLARALDQAGVGQGSHSLSFSLNGGGNRTPGREGRDQPPAEPRSANAVQFYADAPAPGLAALAAARGGIDVTA